jgi:hypothetical protein
LAENRKQLVEPWDAMEQLEMCLHTYMSVLILPKQLTNCTWTNKSFPRPWHSFSILVCMLMTLKWNNLAAHLKNLAAFKMHFLKAQKMLLKQ